jgi:hypothetical protein
VVVTFVVYLALTVAAIVSDILTGATNLTLALGLAAVLVLILLAIEKSAK